jgi:SAM-dependent methyltransferase
MDSLAAVNAKTMAAYEVAAKRYYELFRDEMDEKPYDRELLDRFARAFDDSALICDAGCGPCGHVSRYLHDKGLRVVGIDISPRCIEIARHHSPDLEFAVGDFGNLDFADGACDGIVAYYAIISIPKRFQGDVFREFYRVLKPGGRLLVTVKAGDADGLVDELLGYPTEIHFALFDENEIDSYFADAGFALEFLERRNPYDYEIANERIFAIGRKPQL